ncbi:MAG: ABC transporter ATP-binding protein [Oscillospiraceae bacterium]|nr:ABC transporter ATP-binding protein [Oscillospiraceae bacterium]
MAEKYTPRSVQQGFRRGPGMMGAPIEKAENSKQTLLRLLAYFKPERKTVLLMSAAVLVSVLASVFAPSFQSQAIDKIVSAEYDLLPRILIIMIALYAVQGITTLLQGYISASLSQRIVSRLRTQLFDKIVRLPISYIDGHSHGDLISRMTNDADNISGIISSSLSSLFSGVLMLIGTTAMMLYYSVPLGLLSCSTVILTVFFTSFMSKHMRRYFVKRQELLGRLNGTVEEMVTNYRTITAYNRQKQVIGDFSGTADQLTKTGIIAEIISNCMGPVMNMLSNVSFVIVSVFGAYFALKGYISVGVISAFIIYSKQFSRPINELAQLYGQIQTAIAGAERVFSILDTESEDFSGESTGEVRGIIDFKHVNFSYVEGKRIINDFTLHIESGKKIALVGSTGSGKTTVINLLMRFYEIDSGEILLDGRNIRDLALGELRDSIGIVLQDTKLFSDTVRANLAYAVSDAPQAEIEAAAHASYCDRVIAKLPEQYDTVIGQTGVTLSQGEQQLLAIGRAFLSYPRILILDEATSSVDTRTEQNIQNAMAALMKDRTSLIIAHRLSTIQDADQIIVMDQGSIVESGTHEELLARGGKYHELYMTQFAGQET